MQDFMIEKRGHAVTVAVAEAVAVAVKKMCVCVCVCVCVCEYVNVCVHTCINTHMYTFTTHIYTVVHACE